MRCNNGKEIDNLKIGVFDSGIGGFTVLKELVNNFPNNEYIYLADMLNSPFGDKTEQQIIEITRRILEFFKDKKVESIVCACGTVSGVSIDLLNKFSIKNRVAVYEMTEGVKQSLIKANKKKIFLIATSATITKGFFQKNIKYAEDVEISVEACPEFVKLLESEIRDEEKIEKAVEKHMAKANKFIDSIVLGCTHYGLLKEYVKKNIKNVDIFEAGTCLVNREDLKGMFEKYHKEDVKTKIYIYTTKVTKTIENMSKDIFDSQIEEVKI